MYLITENGHFLKNALEKNKDSYKKMIEEAISETFERINENKSEDEEEKEMKTGDKFIIELGKRIKIQKETSIGEWEIDEAYEVKGTGAVISAKDLEKLEEYKRKPTIPKEEIEKEGYEKGLSELWEALKQIDKMSLKDYEECTGLKFKYDLYFNLTPMELVEKFKEWKEKKEDEEIKVGDEIINFEKEKAVVIHTEEGEMCKIWQCIWKNGVLVLGININEWKKTGKHYDEVEKIFQKLKSKESKFKAGDKVKYKTNGGWYNHGVIEELYEKRCLIKITDKIDGIEHMNISYNDLILDERKEGEIPFL